MKTINGIAGIIFAEKKGERYFLLLHRVLNWTGWEFVKGRLDEGEEGQEEKALLREIEEETGLTRLKVVKRLPEKLAFVSGKGEDRQNDVFLVEADMAQPLNLEQEVIEHDGFKWVKAEEALELVSWPSQKKALAAALKELGKK